MNPIDDAPPPGATASGAPPAGPAPAASRGALEQTVETLVGEILRERRTERRWRIFFRLVWLAVVLAVFWALANERTHHTAPSGPHTALVELRGEIASDTEASAEQLLSGLRSAFEDKGAQAVVLRINSPGGSPVQSGIVYDEIRRLRGKHPEIPLYVVVEDLCASGGYYIASAADKIFVDKASIIGSIDPEVARIVERMQLVCGEAVALMRAWQGEAPQVIYLDPMFSQREKSALVKKEMRLFRALAGADDDAPALLEAALALAAHRVVVKRPRKAPAIAGMQPGYTLEGKSSRFDIYPKRSLKAKSS